MGDIPQIIRTLRQTAVIDVHQDWKDHHFRGHPVLPAVEAMILLAGQMRELDAGMPTQTMERVRFAKFLQIDPATAQMNAFCDLAQLENGQWRATLHTKARSRTSAFSRQIEHAGMVFDRHLEPCRIWPPDLACALAGICFLVAPDTIYRELVPFGPAFRSITSQLALSKEGAMTWVRAPEQAGRLTDPVLGSPFPLDGAFHAACVWSQRYAGVVAFPVAIEKRTVFIPTRPGETYLAHIVPVQVDDPTRVERALLFDLQIMDCHGRIREAAHGVEMRDVSRGHWLPPQWIGLDAFTPQSSNPWPGSGVETAIIERAQVTDSAHLALSPAETGRLSGMGAKRRTDYISARLACKRLWRKLAQDTRKPAPEIETISSDGAHPMLPAVDGHQYYCSVSHDDRFAVAIAANTPAGVDVEKITSRALENSRIFMLPAERNLIAPDGVGASEAAMRIWSLKEAAAKALKIDLGAAWEQIEVLALEKTASRFSCPNGITGRALHAAIDDHLFTLVAGPI